MSNVGEVAVLIIIDICLAKVLLTVEALMRGSPKRTRVVVGESLQGENDRYEIISTYLIKRRKSNDRPSTARA